MKWRFLTVGLLLLLVPLASAADQDGDGVENEEDAFPSDPNLWTDADGDGYGDQLGSNLTDDCPNQPGTSSVHLRGCSDLDRDGTPDLLDFDADGDGISNDVELRAGTDPFDPVSVPSDIDEDGIPDDFDDEQDGDGFPDDLERDRGSDPSDPASTPLTILGGGVYYIPGEGFSKEYSPHGIELSGSRLRALLFARGTIFVLLVGVPLYLIYRARRVYLPLQKKILSSDDEKEIAVIEGLVQSLFEMGRLRPEHHLVLELLIQQQRKTFLDPFEEE